MASAANHATATASAARDQPTPAQPVTPPPTSTICLKASATTTVSQGWVALLGSVSIANSRAKNAVLAQPLALSAPRRKELLSSMAQPASMSVLLVSKSTWTPSGVRGAALDAPTATRTIIASASSVRPTSFCTKGNVSVTARRATSQTTRPATATHSNLWTST